MYKHAQQHKSGRPVSRQQRPRNSSRSSGTGKSLLPQNYRKIIAAILVLGTIIAVLFGLVWFGFSRWQASQIANQKIVFYKTNKDYQIDQILYASLNENEQSVTMHYLPQLAVSNEQAVAVDALIPANRFQQSMPLELALALELVAPAQQVADIDLQSNLKKDFVRVLDTWLEQQTDWLSRGYWWWQTRSWRFIKPANWQKIEYNNLADWQASISNKRRPVPSRDCSVAVVNTTSYSGLARTFTRIFEHSDLFVIRLADSFTNQAESRVVVADPETCSAEQARLLYVFPAIETIEQDTVITSQYRAELVVLLGTDVGEQFEAYQLQFETESAE